MRLIDIIDIKDHIDRESAAEKIRGGIAFRGPNAWILGFAIVLASVGLNVNSVAVIIGAMLVSPLMGPIFGVGLGLGTNDTKLIKDSLMNLLIMVCISLFVSFLYFLITPLNLSNPTELESRTSPTIYDVIIALFGGLAGIFEICRKEKGTVISGVAIATALMPPLCTAGYGIANANLHYFGGAMFLFIINSVFIVLATFAMVKYLKFPEAAFADAKRRKNTRNIVTAVVILVMIPSIWSAFTMIRNTNFRQNIANFVQENKTFSGGYIFDYEVSTKGKQHADIYVTGEPLTQGKKEELIAKAGKFGIASDRINFIEHKIFEENQDGGSSEIVNMLYQRSSDELNRKDLQIKALEGQLMDARGAAIPYVQLTKEIKSAYPEIEEMTFGRGASVQADSLSKNDRIIVVAKANPKLSQEKLRKLGGWLRIRLNDTTVVVMNRN
ncbi:MAG: DUF389 domain-containing protein [Bacteroidales bacterium]|jgi:uncharacterized hydrophobic protein (TIGR00271 family)|nr:DUF389 domain-containing protein [Bacteroidales bacterium]MCI2133895.1 DUF389 domain-containing protein [Bacteroidales bacterium]